MHNIGVPLVEGSPAVDNRLSDLWTKDWCVHRWMVPFHRLNVRAQHHPIDHPRPVRADHNKSGQKGLVGSHLQRSLPQNLVDVGRSSGWSLVLQCCKGLFESIRGGAFWSQRAVGGSFRRIHRNYYWALISLLFLAKSSRTFFVWTLGAGGSFPLSVGGSLVHLRRKSGGEARHFSLPFFSRFANFWIRLVHKPLQSLAKPLPARPSSSSSFSPPLRG